MTSVAQAGQPRATGDPAAFRLGPLAPDLAGASMSLARRLFAGATMWCWSPQWPQHAHHLAVEFVHPVIVGKRALPAVAVIEPDPIETMRTLMVGGDVLVAVGSGSEPSITSAMARAGAWGVETIWIGAGARPALGAADHLLWIDGRDDSAAHTGEFVLLYHLLWELTHVCFEHPGLLEVAPECVGETCITCSDEGRLAEVQAILGDNMASVRTAAGGEEIDVSLVGPVGRGDLVLVHAGTAITQVGIEP